MRPSSSVPWKRTGRKTKGTKKRTKDFQKAPADLSLEVHDEAGVVVCSSGGGSILPECSDGVKRGGESRVHPSR